MYYFLIQKKEGKTEWAYWPMGMINPYVNIWSWFENISRQSFLWKRLTCTCYVPHLNPDNGKSKLFTVGDEKRETWGGCCGAWGSYWTSRRGRVGESRSKNSEGWAGREKGRRQATVADVSFEKFVGEAENHMYVCGNSYFYQYPEENSCTFLANQQFPCHICHEMKWLSFHF